MQGGDVGALAIFVGMQVVELGLGAVDGLVSGITVAPQGGNVWAVGDDGGVFAAQILGVNGSPELPLAPFYGSLPSLGITPDAPIVGISATPDGRGYWLVGTDGGVFAFGDAVFYGSAA